MLSAKFTLPGIRTCPIFRTRQAAAALLLPLALAGCSHSRVPATAAAPTFSSADFTGPYVFTVSGSQADEGDFAAVGSFTADGAGKITSGIADYNLGSGIDSAVQLTGTYTVSAAGLAQVQLTDGQSVKDSFVATLDKSGSAVISNFNTTGSGTLQRPAPGTFSPSGDYTYVLSGQGQGIVSAAGSFSTGASGLLFVGSERYTDQSVTSTSGTLNGFVGPSVANNRGQASFGGHQFVYYLLSPTQLALLGIDERVLLQGTATKH